ncbi:MULTISPECIES: ThiF family adenylyltransferase [unclassified Streptomyces]|uniref:HesA/MoeB/ThiF family protein n=1 Tax=unclassified Streptomyces TaxID=2593676 RepID=UPI00333169B9
MSAPGILDSRLLRRENSAGQVKLWCFASEWELLELADGTVVFHHLMGRQFSLRSVGEPLRRVLRRLEAGPVAFLELCDGDAEAARRLARMLTPLIRQGVLAAARNHARPEWADDRFTERFSTQLEWLASLSPEQHGRWDFMARLREASVAVLGLGGLGSLVALMLAAAGVGRLRLVDGDVVEESNLVRQILYFPDQADGTGKAEALAAQLRRFTPYTEVDVVPSYLSGPEDIAARLDGMDMAALCADAPRFVLNRWTDAVCRDGGIPYLGAFAGQVGPMFLPGESPCFGCFEHYLREDLGPRHDLVVDALAQKRSWRYPAFVSGPVSIAHLMTTEIVLQLTGAATPATSCGVLHIRHPETVREELLPHPDCDCAAAAARSAASAGTAV